MPVKILRDGSTKTLEVTVGEQPGTEQLAQNNGPNNSDTGTLNGVGVGDLDSQARAAVEDTRQRQRRGHHRSPARLAPLPKPASSRVT